jgi:DNA-binding CsgD family transcriptional regulator
MPVAEFTIEERRRKSAELNRLMSRGTGKRPDSLTTREIEVLGWVARGKPAREIAEILQITKRTVNAHVHSAIRKIGAVNRNNAIAIAIRDRIVEV